jgi:transcriptional regulator with XRE-family HTH domain
VTTEERTENLAQLIKRLKDTYNVSGSEIARRIGVSSSAVSGWTTGVRGGKRGPSRENLKALAREFPKFKEQEIFAAAGRQAPGPLSPDAEARILELYRELTPEQQKFTEAQLRAIRDLNHSS